MGRVIRFASHRSRSGLLHDAVKKAEYRRDEQQSRHRGAQQTADYGAAEGRVLFPALAHSQGHRHHTYHHRKRRHDDGTEPGEARFDRCLQGVSMVLQTLFGECDYQDTVSRGHAHAHNRTHQGWNTQMRPGEEQE